jgi:preprotein translocase SecF subunit
MILYLTLRFEFGFALGALVALVHDVLIVLGIYLASGRQVSLITVAAMLTIVGYSINDTIVIFDRIREELKLDQRADVISICNRCINTTMSRTILTSLTTLITALALLIFSKGEIRDFAFTMALGIVFGTLSSIFIATPVMLAVNRGRRPTFGKS